MAPQKMGSIQQTVGADADEEDIGEVNEGDTTAVSAAVSEDSVASGEGAGVTVVDVDSAEAIVADGDQVRTGGVATSSTVREAVRVKTAREVAMASTVREVVTVSTAQEVAMVSTVQEVAMVSIAQEVVTVNIVQGVVDVDVDEVRFRP